ncbi:MAG: hypothetical protein LUG98_08405 [Tannerellaceae bacterium]|nr:hypothetical protein [Tannerellaceae bacterium]
MKSNIYQVVFFLFLWTGTICPVKANSEYRERVYIQTDKNVYLAGELMWLKIYLTDDEGKPTTLSKVGYIEVQDEENSLLQTKIELQEGTGQGCLEIPVTWPTANYRLVGYTRFMNNEGEEVFYNKTISVINTFRTDRTVEVVDSTLAGESKKPMLVNTVDLKTDKQVYGCREEGMITLDNLPADLYSVSISVAGKDLTTSAPVQTIQTWRNELTLMNKPSISSDYLPEYEGHIIKGSFVNVETGAPPAEQDAVISLLAFVGDDIRLFGGRAQGEEVTFYTKGISGREEIATVAIGLTSSVFRLDIQSPFVNPAPVSLPTLSLQEDWEEQLLQRSVGLQTLYLFNADSLNRIKAGESYFRWTPDWTYRLDEYTRFTTMEEVVIEFILPLRFRRINGKRVLSVLTEDRQGFTSGNTLVLLDGIPLLDHEMIFRYDPYSVEKIEVYRGKYVFGGQMFDGIASFKTYNHDYIGLTLDATTQIFDYEGTQPFRQFYMPDYNRPEQKESRLPDYRHTLLWLPEVPLPETQRVSVPFSTSDLTGEFTVTIEGITTSGRTIFAHKEIEVK